AVGGDSPELQRVQRPRVERALRQGIQDPPRVPARGWQAHHLRARGRPSWSRAGGSQAQGGQGVGGGGELALEARRGRSCRRYGPRAALGARVSDCGGDGAQAGRRDHVRGDRRPAGTEGDFGSWPGGHREAAHGRRDLEDRLGPAADKGPSASLVPAAARSTYREYASRAASGRRPASDPFSTARQRVRRTPPPSPPSPPPLRTLPPPPP